MPRKTVLVIEDEPPIRRGLVDALQHAGFTALPAADGDEGLQLARKSDCHLVLLDLTLPRRDGLEILREIRRERPTLPFIILTARGSESARIEGLRLGADDYVVKPFSIGELLARVEAVLRRSPERPLDLSRFDFTGGHVDFSRRQVLLDGGPHEDLSERELEILRYLVDNPGRAISRDELLTRVWRVSPRGIVQTRAIDMHVTRLRAKLHDHPSSPRIILTVRGKGYMIAAAAEPAPAAKPVP